MVLAAETQWLSAWCRISHIPQCFFNLSAGRKMQANLLWEGRAAQIATSRRALEQTPTSRASEGQLTWGIPCNTSESLSSKFKSPHITVARPRAAIRKHGLDHALGLLTLFRTPTSTTNTVQTVTQDSSVPRTDLNRNGMQTTGT